MKANGILIASVAMLCTAGAMAAYAADLTYEWYAAAKTVT